MSMTKCDYKEDVDRLTAKLSTTLGDFTIELYAKECPETVWNFVNLAEGKQETEKGGNFYDGIIFHRVIEGFMLQAGCPLGKGIGGPGYQFCDEFIPELKHDVPGVLSMANTGEAGTNGSQFFVTLAPTPHLDGKHTVFGKVIDGMDVVSKIGVTPTGAMDKPVKNIVINSVIVSR
ncbi:MAG: peptidylprolyl isomerase [Bacteriovoracaceae bacterium]|nr:peptidylprolyl isomerase [Bacteriovoracaceae bacterium]